MKQKLHLGCGAIILPDYVNVDSAKLTGVDVVHDLRTFPWPFEDQSFEEVILVNILEHLPSVVMAMEELHRITRPDGRIMIRVPYFNSWDASADPTHVHVFNESTFDFFDPSTNLGKERSYYSRARFQITLMGYFVYFFRRQYLICRSKEETKDILLPAPYRIKVAHSAFVKKFLPYLAHPLGNIIRALHVELRRV